jgi:phage terminase small subunit
MKRGPKPHLPATKAQRGTLRKDRDGAGPVQMIAPGDPPIMPDYLPPAAQEVWIEEIGRVMVAGITELDSSLFATYCATEALVRAAYIAGEPPPAAYLSELRRMRELLGIAGPRVRQGAKPGGATIENPFARNGRRAAA